MLTNGSFTTNPQEIANTLNDFFVNIGPDLANKLDPSIHPYDSYIQSRNRNSFFLSPTGPIEIMKILSSFKNSVGPDKIPSKILKLGARSLSLALSILINECFSKGVFPKCLKFARVTPIFKGGEPFLPPQWRPISIVPTLSKLIEKLACKRLTKYFKKYDILTNNRLGFQSGHSTAHAILVQTSKSLEILIQTATHKRLIKRF